MIVLVMIRSDIMSEHIMMDPEIYNLSPIEEMNVLCTCYTLDWLFWRRENLIKNINSKVSKSEFKKHRVLYTANLTTIKEAINHYDDEEYEIARAE